MNALAHALDGITPTSAPSAQITIQRLDSAGEPDTFMAWCMRCCVAPHGQY